MIRTCWNCAFAADPNLRYLRARYLYLELWAAELETLAGHYFQHAVSQCQNHFGRTVQHWFVKHPLSRAIHKRRMHIHFEAARTLRHLNRYQRAIAKGPLALQYPLQKALAASAGAPKIASSADPSHISLIAQPLTAAPGIRRFDNRNPTTPHPRRLS